MTMRTFILVALILMIGSPTNATPKQKRQKTSTEQRENNKPNFIAPKFMDGDINRFRDWVNSRLEYPKSFMNRNIPMIKLSVDFLVDENGTAHVLTKVDESDPMYDLYKAADDAINSSPQWEPGKDLNGNPVKVRYTLPIHFKNPQPSVEKMMEHEYNIKNYRNDKPSSVSDQDFRNQNQRRR